MKTAVISLLAVTLLTAAAASAQTLGTILPSLSFPDDVVTSSTKGCDATAQTVCTLEK